MIGRSIIVTLGEPSDFSHNPFIATIEKTHTEIISTIKGEIIKEQILIKANKAFEQNKLKSEYFIASPRYVDERISELLAKGELIIGMHRITELRAKADNPFTENEIRGDEKSWCGIGDFKLCT